MIQALKEQTTQTLSNAPASANQGAVEMKAALRIVTPYLIFAALWILLSDKIAYHLAPDLDQFRMAGMVKGLLFVAVSGMLLLMLLTRELRRRHAIEEERADLLTREQAARARFESANRAKDELLALVSHELRTPLTAILTSTELLGSEQTLSDDQRELIGTIRESVLEESRIVSDLLDATSLAAGRLELHLERLDIHSAIQTAINEVRPTAIDKRVTLKTDFTARSAHVSGDKLRLTQVFRNLLGNAVKFTARFGTITLTTRDTTTGVEIEVLDTGIGMEPAFRERVFEPFEQGDRSITRNYGGLGLGLHLVRSIVELHGGRVQASSEGAGKGSAFVVRLPLAIDGAEPTRVGSLTPAPLANCRVLLVEDNMDTLRVLGRLLGRLGCTVLAARSAEEALRLVKNGVDLVVSDIGLPDRSGWDLMRELREEHDVAGIAISGFGSDEDRQKSLDAGFDRHIVKPISFPALQAAVVELFAGRKDAAQRAQASR